MMQTKSITQPLTRKELLEPFRRGCKTPKDFRIGVEWEKLGVYRQTGEAIPYHGDRGVKAIFKALEGRFGWEAVLSQGGQPIALRKGEGSITLEPGCQIELSGKKALNLTQNAEELRAHLAELKTVSEPLGVAWLGLGAQPFSKLADIEWTPKERYDIMRSRLKKEGRQTYRMMKETASVQVSLDFSTLDDAMFKFRLAMALSPVLSALFANSPLEVGRASGFLSRRAQIWRHTDPSRSGILWDVFKKNYTLDDYVDYALDVPALFLQRGGRYIAMPKMTFRSFLAKGWNDLEATGDDWQNHLTTIFTEARLKSYLEIRSVDCQESTMGMAAVAFIKGIFYSKTALADAWSILGGISVAERKKVWRDVPLRALSTRWDPERSRTSPKTSCRYPGAG